MKTLPFAGSFCVLFLLGSINFVSAEAILDTLSFPQASLPVGGGVVISNVPLDAVEPLGTYSVLEMFTFNNSNPNHYLASVTLRLEQSPVGGAISVALLDGGRGLLAPLDGPSDPATGVVTYWLSTPIDLTTAGSTADYFIELRGTGHAWVLNEVPEWNAFDPSTKVGWGATYDAVGGLVDGFHGGNSGAPSTALAMQLTAFSTIPEPSSFALAGVGVGVLTVLRRRL